METMVETIPDILDPDLFDESPEQDELYGYELNDGLTEEQNEDAIKIAERWKILRGIVVVTGEVGSGKDLFGNWLSYRVKRYFKGRRALRDERPRRLYGQYEPFDEISLAEDVEKLKAMSSLKTNKERAIQSNKYTQQWMAESGEVKLKNAVLYLTEFWRYMYNRDPFNPMGMLCGAIVKTWRHLDLLLIGTAPKKRELDKFSCLPYVTHQVRCYWIGNDTAGYIITPVKYVGRKGVMVKRSKPFRVSINGAEPRDLLGGKCIYDLYVSKSPVALSKRRV